MKKIGDKDPVKKWKWDQHSNWKEIKTLIYAFIKSY